MHRSKHLAVVFAATSLLPLVAGCGGSPGADSSRVEAKVSGVVKFQGKPVSAGEVTFFASNVERQVGGASGKIGPDGTYSLTTLAGSNAVKFAGPFIDKDRTLLYKKRVVTVNAGENPGVDFDLGGEVDDTKGPMYPSGKKGRRR